MYQQPNLVQQQQQQQQQQNGSVNGAVTPTQNGLKRPGSPSTNGANTPESVAAQAAQAAGLPNGAVPPNYMVPFFDPMRMANPAQVQAALAAAAAAAANGMPPLRPVHPGAAAVSGAPLLINNGQAGPDVPRSVAPAGFASPLGLGPPAQNSLGYGGNSNPLGGLSSRRDSAGDRAQPAFSPSLVEQYKNKPSWPGGPSYNPLGPLGLTAPSPPPPGGTLGLFSGGGGGRFSTAPGSDRAFPGGGNARNGGGGGGLFGSSNNLFGGGGHHGGKQRHSSIDKAASNRSKLLEDFR